LKDLGFVQEEEPFKKLINQGMIQGVSQKVHISGGPGYTSGSNFHSVNGLRFQTPDSERLLLSHDVRIKVDGLDDEDSISKSYYTTSEHNVDIQSVNPLTNELDIEKYIEWRPEYKNALFWCSGGVWQAGKFYPLANSEGTDKFYTKPEVEKMSKSKFNVVNPDDIIERYGADTLRLYEMFLGPLEQSKPWNTNGIEGVFKFLRKLWRLFHDEQFNFKVSDEEPSKSELKSLHKIILKVQEDIERFSFNTSVSSFMICVNELTDQKCTKRKILQNLVIVLAPYAPHITEELWTLLGNKAGTLTFATYPTFNPEYLVEDEFAYPISINGKMKMNLNMSLTLEAADIEKFVLENADVQKYLDGKTPKKVIVVKGKIVNMVV
jgi:leucyl-tRNA synthetase